MGARTSDAQVLVLVLVLVLDVGRRVVAHSALQLDFVLQLHLLADNSGRRTRVLPVPVLTISFATVSFSRLNAR